MTSVRGALGAAALVSTLAAKPLAPLFAFEVSPSLTVGDLLQIAAVVGSIFVAYQAVKGQLAQISADIVRLSSTVEKHDERLDAHAKSINTLEGRVLPRPPRASD